MRTFQVLGTLILCKITPIYGLPPACLKPDPVAIRLTAKKTICLNFEINTKFNLLTYGVITTNILHVL